MAKATRKRKTTPVKKPPHDRAIISACVVYAQSISAYHAGFKGDPDGNSAYAAPLGERHYSKARDTLAKIATMKATSAAGLSAMARIVPFVASDNEGVFGEQDAAAFVLAFAINVKEWLRPIADGHIVLRSAKDEAAI